MSEAAQLSALTPVALPDADPAVFLIVSCGQTGAFWLGTVLHKHPDILCSAGTDHPLMSLNYEYNADEIVRIRAGIRNAEDFPYGVSPGLANVLRQGGFFKYGYVQTIADQFSDIFIPLEVPLRGNASKGGIFEELKTLPKINEYKAWGNVSGLTAVEYTAELHKGEPFHGRSHTVANLVRHPIVRLDTVVYFFQSLYENVAQYTQMIDAEMAAHRATLELLQDEWNINFSHPRDRAFFHVELVNKHTLWWAQDVLENPAIPCILFEKLRTDRDYFAGFVHKITAGKVVADDAYLDWVFDPANIDAGRVSDTNTRKKRGNPREVYESWPTWQQEHVSRTFKTFAVAKVYEPMGYDLSFLRPV